MQTTLQILRAMPDKNLCSQRTVNWSCIKIHIFTSKQIICTDIRLHYKITSLHAQWRVFWRGLPLPLTTTPTPPSLLKWFRVGLTLPLQNQNQIEKKNLTDNSIILHSWQLLFQTIKIENYERGPACVCRTHTNTQKDIYIISPNYPCYTFFLGKCCLEICIPFVCFFFCLFVCLFLISQKSGNFGLMESAPTFASWLD